MLGGAIKGVNLMKSEALLEFHLDGENYIEAELLSKTIHDFAELTKLAAKEENPEAYLKMNVTAFRNGSFQIDFSAVYEITRNLLTPENISTAKDIISTVIGFFEIKKHLKGKEPRSVEPVGDKLEIKNDDGEAILVNGSSGAVINNIKVDQLTMNIAYNIGQHNPNGGFSLGSDDCKMVCSASDVKNISKALPITEKTNCRRYSIDAILPIKKADILGRSAWSFKYQNHNIDATIEDDDFLEKVHTGVYSIHAGDYIDATMLIFVDLDDDGNELDDTVKYSVVKIRDGIKNDNSGYSQMPLG